MPTFRRLNPKKHHIILAGYFPNYGSVNVVGGITYTAAVYGPATGTFDVINTGKIVNYPNAGLDSVSSGLLLAAPGTVNNLGTVSAPEGIGILLQSTAPGSRVINSGVAYGDVGIQLNGAGTVSNTGSIHGYRTGLYLQAGGQISNHGTIDAVTGAAIYAAGVSATIDNTGKLAGRDGIYVDDQSIIQNGASGIITGINYGVDLLKAGYLSNLGIISADVFAVRLRDGGTVITTGTLLGEDGIYSSSAPVYVANRGYIHAQIVGIDAIGGGSFYNAGSISAGDGITVENLSTSVSYVHNSGVINATAGVAIYLQGLGYGIPNLVTNLGQITASGDGIESFGAGNIENSGLISGGQGTLGGGDGIVLGANSYVLNEYGARILGADGIVLNAGTVINQTLSTITGLYTGITSSSAVNILNFGQISGRMGIRIDGSGSVGNGGTIAASTSDGVLVYSFGTTYNYVINTGLITSTAADGVEMSGNSFCDILNGFSLYNGRNIPHTIAGGKDGVFLGGAGIIVNDGLGYGHRNYGQGCQITGGQYGVVLGPAANGLSTTAFLYNKGTIYGGRGGILAAAGVLIKNTGYISTVGEYGVVLGPAANGNSATTSLYNSGLIYGGYGGILASVGATITNDGRIFTGGAYAIQFNAYYSNRLIINNRAFFLGAVYGGNGALEFAADGTAIGFFSATEQTTFTGFTSLQIDSGATWDLAGNFTLAAATALLNNGTILETAADTLTIDAPITGTGTIAMSKNPLTLKGPVANTQNILFTGSGEELALTNAAAFKGKIEKFAAHDEIFLTNVSLSQITATHFIAGVLTLSEAATKLEFTFANPASFGNETFKVSAQGHGTAISLVNAAAVLSVSPLTTPSPFITLGN